MEDNVKRRKPAEPRLWLAVSIVTDVATGETYPQANLSRYAHKTKKAGLNDVIDCLEKRYPDQRYKYEIIDVVGVKWGYFAEAFSDFIDGDDDDRGADDESETDPDPEDHGADVPAPFAEFIDSLTIHEPV